MGDSDEEPVTPDELPGSLVTQLDFLEVPELKAVRSYVNQRIGFIRPPIEEEIKAEAAVEIIAVEDRSAYPIVQMHPPDPHGSGGITDVVSPYHLRRESQPDGTESLHGSYLGDIRNPSQNTCRRKPDSDVTRCPNCNPDQSEHPEKED